MKKEFPGLGKILNMEEAANFTGLAVNTLKVYSQSRNENGIVSAIPAVYARMPWQKTRIKKMWYATEILSEWKRQLTPRAGDLTEKMESLMVEAELLELSVIQN